MGCTDCGKQGKITVPMKGFLMGRLPGAKKPEPQVVIATTAYLGFDYLAYPGDDTMRAWWSGTPLWYTGFYLGPAPNHADATWMPKRAFLKGIGWGFLIIYVGLQEGEPGLTYAQGQAHADNAVSLAQQAGFPAGATIFLDVEDGGTLSTQFIDYIKGWIERINSSATIYWAGVYCSWYQTAQQIRNALPNARITFWCYNPNCPPSPGCQLPSPPPDPATCGYSGAVVWQYAVSPLPEEITCSGYSGNQCTKTYGGHPLNVDLDSAYSQNPSGG